MRRRINLTKQPLSKWFVKMRRKYLKMKKWSKETINNEFD
jgi:hypothetical protein